MIKSSLRNGIIRTRRLPRGVVAMVLFGIILTPYAALSPATYNHERIHCRQQWQLLFIPFFIIYGIEWAIKFAIYRDWDTAYRNISFEREAYANQHNPNYRKTLQHPLSWLKYIHEK